MRIPLPCAALLVALLAACQPVRPQAPAPIVAAAPAHAATVPADDNLNAVLWVQRSAEYQANAIQTYRAAAGYLDKALAEPHWDALVPTERDNTGHGLKPAVVLDIDETVLDNSPYQARLVRDGLEYSDPTWDAWVEERRATPVPGVLEFARAAQARGVTLVYISNRAVHLKQATLDNLRAQGLPVADDSVFLGLGTVVEGCQQHGSEKDCRRRLATPTCSSSRSTTSRRTRRSTPRPKTSSRCAAASRRAPSCSRSPIRVVASRRPTSPWCSKSSRAAPTRATGPAVVSGSHSPARSWRGTAATSRSSRARVRARGCGCRCRRTSRTPDPYVGSAGAGASNAGHQNVEASDVEASDDDARAALDRAGVTSLRERFRS